ncbi:hypothetical protein [Rossellomorea marisflavi]|uniref:hypothetical protein n=1 Tax=Rossellomorea marisflavi TaxID=189381 RepID=UPI0018CD558A|nr:hypothetical protein [Rossellomorea marisflavi]
MQSTYRETKMHSFFPAYLLDNLFEFILEHQHRNRKHLSPYKFGNKYNLPVNDAIKFFLFLTGEERPLDITWFIECSNMSCGHRYFFSKDEFEKLNSVSDGIIFCEECEKLYNYKEVQTFIKAYFILNMDDNSRESVDPNSTFEALGEIAPYLKEMSPLSIIGTPENDIIKDGGDELGIELQVLSELNKTPNDDTISKSVEEIMLFVNGFIKK